MLVASVGTAFVFVAVINEKPKNDNMKRFILITAGIMLMSMAYPQTSFFESREIQRAYENETRSHKGLPGEKYWQNAADYNLKAELNPETKILKGTGTITYYNNSPDSLRFFVIKLLPNIHKEGAARDYAVGAEHTNVGMIIDSIAINNVGEDILNRRKFREWGTNMYVIFGQNDKVAPGTKTEIYLSWNYEVIDHGIRNGAFTDSSFFIGYWYPQMAVYDDVYHWDREDYTGKQETYNDLGTYDVEITVPDDYIVWATGDQLNEDEIFSKHTLELIQKSRESDETITIARRENYANNEIFKKDHSSTWKFHAENVPDFAWACSNYYNWDANNLSLQNENSQNIWINVAYPPQSPTFDKVADIAHHSIDYLSNVFPGIPYPFNKHITFNGINNIAVEYPMMANNSEHAGEEMYTELTIHEIAHNYIPFYMLSNERKHAWIDEGWVKLIGELYGESLGIKREEKAELNTIQNYERFAGTSNDLPLIVPSGFMTTGYNYYHSYAKAANANYFLLELMNDKGIDNPLREFLLSWEGKHPTPYDFFNFMNTLIGEDLSWFWAPWYFEFSSPDLAIAKSDIKNHVLITNEGGIPLPIKLQVVYVNDQDVEIEMSISNWSKSPSLDVEISNMQNVKMITLGAPNIPDIHKDNNVLRLLPGTASLKDPH